MMCLIAPQGRSALSQFVKCTTLLATFVLFTLAVSHVVYLFEAFEAKDGIESLLQSGSELYTHEKFLWYLLYSFGEADHLQDLRQRSNVGLIVKPQPAQIQPASSSSSSLFSSSSSSSTSSSASLEVAENDEDGGGASLTGGHTNTNALIPDYRNHLRVWKLTGLICLYCIAVGVNLGLVLGVCRKISAFFIPWLVVNLVFVLVFFSLSLGTVIVHLAYHDRSPAVDENSILVPTGDIPPLESNPVPYSGLWCALIPFSVFLLLGVYWILVLYLYLVAVKSERHLRRAHRDPFNCMTGSHSNYPMSNGTSNGFGQGALMTKDAIDGQSALLGEKQDASTSPMKSSPNRSRRFMGLFRCCGAENSESFGRNECTLSSNKPLDDGVFYQECVQSMIIPDDSSEEDEANPKEDHSPFLPEMIKKEERRKIQKRRKEKEKEERRLNKSKERLPLKSTKPSSPPLEEQSFIHNAIYEPLKQSEDVNLWTEFDGSGHRPYPMGRPSSLPHCHPEVSSQGPEEVKDNIECWNLNRTGADFRDFGGCSKSCPLEQSIPIPVTEQHLTHSAPKCLHGRRFVYPEESDHNHQNHHHHDK
ncbi:uncharacterized protein LOC131890366 [Tigriopus californicus]|uniref:uncharacterized protein LOC131890366 n=1 Tax=Tigriopus californicus TaxID=6832 RepID=UPI0027D9D2CC|nr:uncharacterized protein LOC131890366 [Tigriopus californicus]XP_059095685.1 uncharacterized protein LOC131890366 [Tigriopus californicus]